MLCLVVVTTVTALALTAAPAESADELPVLRNVEPPVLTGDAWPGQALQVSDGVWDADDVQVTYQWLRNGQLIEGATDAAHLVTDEDIGAGLSAVVTASADGYAPGSAVSNIEQVWDVIVDPPMSHRVRARLLHRVVRPNQRPQLTVRVLRADAEVTGRIWAYVGGRKVRVAHVRRGEQGVTRLRLPRQRPGRHAITVFFSEDGAMGPSMDRVLLRVRP
jgi:hypothetical protein